MALMCSCKHSSACSDQTRSQERRGEREGRRKEGRLVPEYTAIFFTLKFNQNLEHTFYLLMSLNSGVENEPTSSGNEERSLVKVDDFIEIWKKNVG